MIKVAICDDNQIQLDLAVDIVSSYPKKLDIKAFPLGTKLLEEVEKSGPFDIYILDLLMPEINGIEVAKALRDLGDNGKIIFLTSSLDYAIESYDVKAFYYMVKPIDVDKLYKVLDNATEDLVHESATVEIRTSNGLVRIPTSDIMYVEIVNRALRYHISDGRIAYSTTIRTSFKDAIAPLIATNSFVTIAQNTAVNLAYIDQINATSVFLHDGTVLYPSRANIATIKDTWRNF